MKKSPKILKLAFRFLIMNLVYFLVKMTVVDRNKNSIFENNSLFYYITTCILFIVIWETNDWLIKKQITSKEGNGLNFSNSIVILIKSMCVLLPTAATLYYLGIFQFNNICNIIIIADPTLHFRTDFFRAALIGLVVVIFNLFYHSSKQKVDVEHKMEALKKEIITSKYKSLKNQISPHFLFNSLNTLTSLMYEDRDLASDFVSRLASSYRYILDNRENDLVNLKKELSFLDSFIFMMNVRHKDSIKISTHISINPADFFIPTLSLQMLVENAVKHNYFSKEKPLEINIFSVENHNIVIENTLRKRELKEESTKLGLKNIKKRYAFYTDQPVLIEKNNNHFGVTLPLLSKSIKEITIRSAS